MKPMLTTYRYGSRRQPGEGLRIGVARHVPRGVRREDWQRGGYFDTWVPLLAPTSDVVAAFKHGKIPFSTFARHYKSQMKASEPRQIIGLLAALSLRTPISIGCYCEDESCCHRSLLRPMILAEAKDRKIV